MKSASAKCVYRNVNACTQTHSDIEGGSGICEQLMKQSKTPQLYAENV